MIDTAPEPTTVSGPPVSREVPIASRRHRLANYAMTTFSPRIERLFKAALAVNSLAPTRPYRAAVWCTH